MKRAELLNLGCGSTYDKSWINIDFASHDSNIIKYDLRKGIPRQDNSCDVVYHSHILEHFSKTDGASFIRECYRVLKPGGIIRIAVPDLEGITREYLTQLENCLANNAESEQKYHWIKMELIDQMVRNSPGGEMLKYIQNEFSNNKEYLRKRCGLEIDKIYSNVQNANQNVQNIPKTSLKQHIKNLLDFSYWKEAILRFILKEEYLLLTTGRFRFSGEIHQWMYDEYSLGLELKKAGFSNVKKQKVDTSLIEKWNSYDLDALNGQTRKPDSLYIEAVKLI